MIKLIAAVDRNFVLGENNTIPWYYPEDLKRFKKNTSDSVLIVGRKTLQSFPKKLPNRITIAISQTIKEHEFADSIFDSYEKAVTEALMIQTRSFKNIWICGGSNVYEQALKDARVDYLDITFVPELTELQASNVVFFKSENLKHFSVELEFINEKDKRLTHKIYRRIKK
jgi:dihydrofolate reductase